LTRHQRCLIDGDSVVESAPAQITLDSTVCAASHHFSCDLEAEAAILNLKTGVYHGLNPVGAAIWQMLEKPISVRELLEAMLAQFEVERDACQIDLMRLLNELNKRGLISVADGPSR
jgi:hypothetical protein